MNSDDVAMDLLRQAGVTPAPRPDFHPYFGGRALFVKGRRRAWYRAVPNQPGLFDVYGDTFHWEIVLGEDIAQQLCHEWTEKWGETYRIDR